MRVKTYSKITDNLPENITYLIDLYRYLVKFDPLD